MSILTVELKDVSALDVKVTNDALAVELSDGRTVSVPLVWYPRLLAGSRKERSKWQFNGGGHGIHWPDLDEDISVPNLVLGQASRESQSSFNRWLSKRK